MFKALFNLLKSLFTTASRATKALDDVTSAGLFYSDTFLRESYKEHEVRSKELDINEDDFKAAVEKIRKL